MRVLCTWGLAALLIAAAQAAPAAIVYSFETVVTDFFYDEITTEAGETIPGYAPTYADELIGQASSGRVTVSDGMFGCEFLYCPSGAFGFSPSGDVVAFSSFSSATIFNFSDAPALFSTPAMSIFFTNDAESAQSDARYDRFFWSGLNIRLEITSLQRVDTDAVPSVPLPATLWLLAATLAAAGIADRRRRSCRPA